MAYNFPPRANTALTNLSLSGTNGQVLTLQSGGPVWADAAGGASFPLLGSLGAANAPTYSFLGDPDTGMWSSGANTLNLSTNGTERLRVDASGNVKVPNYILSPQVYNNGAYSSGTITIDWATSPVQTIVVQGNITLTFINQVKGGAYALRIRQDGVGGTITWPSDVSWPGDTAPTLSSPGNMDIINFLYFTDLGKYLATSALNFPFTLTGDADAENFITNAGISDETQQDAIRVLVTDLKGYGLWSKMKAIYPFVGGTASTHKWNLKDPRDLDAAFRLTFVNSWTHSATGAHNNGVGYANTYLVPATNYVNITDKHMSLYSRTSPALVALDMGVGLFNNSAFQMYIRFTDGTAIAELGHTSTGGQVIRAVSSGLGMCIINSSLTESSIRFNNNKTVAPALSGVVLYHLPHYIGASNHNHGPAYPTNREFAFASIGNALSATEESNFVIAVQAFQTTLGRAV